MRRDEGMSEERKAPVFLDERAAYFPLYYSFFNTKTYSVNGDCDLLCSVGADLSGCDGSSYGSSLPPAGQVGNIETED